MKKATMFLRFSGPQQSYGHRSNFSFRDAGDFPTRSSIIGAICCANGQKRNFSLEGLLQLKNFSELSIGVRIDKEGRTERDFQTVGCGKIGDFNYAVIRANKEVKSQIILQKFYLTDAKFIVGIHGNIEILQKINDSIKNPKHPIYLGRKSFFPTEPIYVQKDFVEKDIKESLMEFPILNRDIGSRKEIRFIFESNFGDGIVMKDIPISFEYNRRKFAPRYIKMELIGIDKLNIMEEK